MADFLWLFESDPFPTLIEQEKMIGLRIKRIKWKALIIINNNRSNFVILLNFSKLDLYKLNLYFFLLVLNKPNYKNENHNNSYYCHNCIL